MKKVYPWLAFLSKNHDEAIRLADWATEQMMKARLDKELAGGQAGTANYSANYSWNPQKILTPNPISPISTTFSKIFHPTSSWGAGGGGNTML